MSKNAFENACGLSTRYVSNISASVSPDKLKQISLKFPELNVEWLLTGQGNMLRELFSTTTNIGDITVTGNGNSHIGHGQHNVPAIIEVKENGVEVECPNCGEVIEVTNTAVIPLVPPEVAKRPDINLESFRHNCPQQMEEVDLRQVWGKGVFLMKVDTRAMEPEYREGTFLVLRRLKDLSYARPDGSAYVIDTMRPHTLFRYLSKERDGTYVLSAESDKRGPIYLNAEDIINIYDVVGSFRIGR
jgi:hypothetical protein